MQNRYFRLISHEIALISPPLKLSIFNLSPKHRFWTILKGEKRLGSTRVENN